MPGGPARGPRRPGAGTLVLLGLLAFLVAYPLAQLVLTSFDVADGQGGVPRVWGLANYAELGRHLNWIGNSLTVSLGATAIAIVVATALAWIVARTVLPGRALFETLIVVPYYVTPLVGGLAWSALGAPGSGLLNRAFEALTGRSRPLLNVHSELGIILVMAVFELPVAFLMISAAMRGMDPSLEETAAVLGGGKLMTARRVTLPLLRPAILGAALFLFASMMSAFAIPAILGTQARFYVVTTAVYQLFQMYPPNYPLTAALGVALVLFTAIAVWLYARALGSRSYAVIGGRAYRPRRIAMGPWTPLLVGVCSLYVAVGVLLPLGVLLLASIQKSNVIVLAPSAWTLDNYRYVLFEHGPTRQALGNSLVLGVLTGTCGIALAGSIAWVTCRTRARARRLVEQLAMFPQAVPRLVFSLGLLWAWLAFPATAAIYGTIWILLLAYLTVFLPLGTRSLSGVMVQLDRSLEESARVLGAGWLRTVRTVTLPLLRPGMVSTWMLLFILSIREVSASVLLSSPRSRVLGPAIFNFWESGGLARVSALSIVQSVIILLGLLLMQRVTAARRSG